MELAPVTWLPNPGTCTLPSTYTLGWFHDNSNTIFKRMQKHVKKREQYQNSDGTLSSGGLVPHPAPNFSKTVPASKLINSDLFWSIGGKFSLSWDIGGSGYCGVGGVVVYDKSNTILRFRNAIQIVAIRTAMPTHLGGALKDFNLISKHAFHWEHSRDLLRAYTGK